METLSINNYKHAPETIRSYFKVVGDRTLVNNNIFILFPKRYINKNLALLSPTGCKVIGIYAIVDNNNNYAKVLNPIFQNLLPSNIEYYEIDGVEYVSLVFNKGDVFLVSNTLAVFNSYLYDIFDEFFLQGRIPWFMEYEDICGLLSESQKYCNTDIGDSPFNYEVLTSNIAKDPVDHRIRFRNSNAKKPIYVGMSDIRYGYSNTGSRMIGGYLKDGMIASIVDPETVPSKSIEVLRY